MINTINIASYADDSTPYSDDSTPYSVGNYKSHQWNFLNGFMKMAWKLIKTKGFATCLQKVEF